MKSTVCMYMYSYESNSKYLLVSIKSTVCACTHKSATVSTCKYKEYIMYMYSNKSNSINTRKYEEYSVYMYSYDSNSKHS